MLDIKEYIKKASEGIKGAKLMTFCGTHEHTIVTAGIRSILPGGGIELIPGPGCPVCITPASIVDQAIQLSMEGIEVITFGDSYKLPSIKWTKKDFPRSLMEARERGGKVRVVYSPLIFLRPKIKKRYFLLSDSKRLCRRPFR